MRTRLLNLLLLAALVYCASRLWSFLREPPPALPAIETVAAAPVPAAAEPPEPQPAEPGPEAYEVIVARDLFSPTRGVVPPRPVTPPRGEKDLEQRQAPPKLTLFGVVIVDGEKAAFIQEGTQEGRPRKVRENEPFAGGTISAIRPDGVTFRFAGTEVIVPLRTLKEVPANSGQEPRAAAQQPKAPAPYPRRVTQPAAGRAPMPPGAIQNRMQPNITRGPLPPGITQGQIPAALTPDQEFPALSPFPPPSEQGGGEAGDEEIPQESPFDGAGEMDPTLEE